MKTPLEQFNTFLEETEAKPYHMTIARVVELAEKLGFTKEDVRRACREIRHWLAGKEDYKVTQKTKWGQFILNWLKPKPVRKSRRAEPSNFQGESRIEE